MKNQAHVASNALYTFPSLECDITTLESFLSNEKPQDGLPLFEISIEIETCYRVANVLSTCCCNTDSNYNIPVYDALGSLRLLRCRFSLLDKVLNYGLNLCVKDAPISLQSHNGPVFNIRNKHDNLEDYFISKTTSKKEFPLLGVSTSIKSIISMIDTVLFLYKDKIEKDLKSEGCGDDFKGPLQLIWAQLELIKDAIELAVERSIWITRGNQS